MKLQVKFREDATKQERDKVIGSLPSQGATSIRPLFPETSDRKRGSLYVVETGEEGAPQVLGYLDAADAVEVAEPEVRRRLAR